MTEPPDDLDARIESIAQQLTVEALGEAQFLEQIGAMSIDVAMAACIEALNRAARRLRARHDRKGNHHA